MCKDITFKDSKKYNLLCLNKLVRYLLVISKSDITFQYISKECYKLIEDMNNVILEICLEMVKRLKYIENIIDITETMEYFTTIRNKCENQRKISFDSLHHKDFLKKVNRVNNLLRSMKSTSLKLDFDLKKRINEYNHSPKVNVTQRTTKSEQFYGEKKTINLFNINTLSENHSSFNVDNNVINQSLSKSEQLDDDKDKSSFQKKIKSAQQPNKHNNFFDVDNRDSFNEVLHPLPVKVNSSAIQTISGKLRLEKTNRDFHKSSSLKERKRFPICNNNIKHNFSNGKSMILFSTETVNKNPIFPIINNNESSHDIKVDKTLSNDINPFTPINSHNNIDIIEMAESNEKKPFSQDFQSLTNMFNNYKGIALTPILEKKEMKQNPSPIVSSGGNQDICSGSNDKIKKKSSCLSRFARSKKEENVITSGLSKEEETYITRGSSHNNLDLVDESEASSNDSMEYIDEEKAKTSEFKFEKSTRSHLQFEDEINTENKYTIKLDIDLEGLFTNLIEGNENFLDSDAEDDIYLKSRQLNDTCLDSFTYIKSINKGGYGRVDLYKMKNLEDKYAIKTVNIDFMVIIFY